MISSAKIQLDYPHLQVLVKSIKFMNICSVLL